MNQGKKQHLETANRVARNCHLITVVLITLAYLIEVFKGTKTIEIWLLCALTGLIPVIMEVICYHRNAAHQHIRDMIVIGYLLFYGISLFTALSILTFIFAVPMLVACTVYSNVKYSLIFGILTLLENVLHVVYQYMQDQLVPEGLPYYEIRFLMLVVVISFTIYTSRTLQKLSEQQIQTAETEKSKSEDLLNRVLKVSEHMKKIILVVSKDVKLLGDSVKNTQTAMGELSEGATDTASAIQEQVLQTEAITHKVGQVKDTSSKIAENMKNTRSAIGLGHERIEELMVQVTETERNNVEVVKELEDLKGYMEQMHSIIEIINNITTQTSLLSLNATIEAARAGESGRGFAVVASEISGLANQTKEATVNIESLIGNVGREIGLVVTTIENMLHQVKRQNEIVNDTAESFESVTQNTQEINELSGTLGEIVDELEEANNLIMDSIQTISGVSEEVTAQTDQTYQACEENAQTVNEVAGSAIELETLAKQLN
jgi:methyl-accepting chemotaxis protein